MKLKLITALYVCAYSVPKSEHTLPRTYTPPPVLLSDTAIGQLADSLKDTDLTTHFIEILMGTSEKELVGTTIKLSGRHLGIKHLLGEALYGQLLAKLLTEVAVEGLAKQGFELNQESFREDYTHMTLGLREGKCILALFLNEDYNVKIEDPILDELKEQLIASDMKNAFGYFIPLSF